MNERTGRTALVVVALLLCGTAVSVVAWMARRDVASPSPATVSVEVEEPSGGSEGEAEERLLAPSTPVAPESGPQGGAGPPSATTPALPEARSILEETAAHWERQYRDVGRAQVQLDLARLVQEYQAQSKAEFERRFESGDFEVVEGATEPRNEPWRPGAFLQMEMPGGEAADEVHRVVLHQYEVPELYAIQAKAYWLQQRVDALRASAGGER